MPTVRVPKQKVIGAFNVTSALLSWLRPGYLAFVIGEHVDALRDAAVRLHTTRSQMLDEAAAKHPTTIVGGPDDGKPNPKAGQHVTMKDPTTGVEMTAFRSKEAGDEFTKRDAELMTGVVEIDVSERLTLEHVRLIDRERLDKPRALNGVAPSADAIDFSALIVLVDRPTATVVVERTADDDSDSDARDVVHAPDISPRAER